MCSMSHVFSSTNNHKLQNINVKFLQDGGDESLKGFFGMLARSGLSDNTDEYNRLLSRYRDLHKDTSYSHYVNMYNNIVAYYVSHGKYTSEEYAPLWDWQYNSLYLRNDFSKFKEKNMISIVDELLSNDYSIDDIRRVIRYLILFDFTRFKPLGDDVPRCKPIYGNISTTEYVEFLEVLSTTQDKDMLIASPTLCGVINYYFDYALASIGCVSFNFFPDLFDYVANYLPLHVALDRYFDPQAQGSVEDYGYIGLMRRSIKSTLDVPHQIHRTVESVADASNSMSICADKMARLGDSMTAFIDSFLKRTSVLADGITSEMMMSMIEIFVDFMSDLPDLKQVSVFRWTTYCSRILRLFIPNCVSMAFNLFSTYLSGLITTVAQGFDDLLQTILVVFSGAIALQGVPDKVGVNKMLEYMKTVNITVPFSKNMITVIHSMISMLPEAVKAWASQYIPEHVFYVKLTTQYADVLKRIDAFLMYDIDRIYFNKALSKELLELHAKAHDLVVDMAPFIRDVSGEFSLLREQLRKFDKLYDSFKSIDRCGVIRECPFSLTIFGRSQIGKSTLSAAVAKYMFPDTPADRVRYVIPTGVS